MPIRIHAIIFCWPGKTLDAQHICASVAKSAGRVTVVDASTGPVHVSGNLEWIKIDRDNYFVHQFVRAPGVLDQDVMMRIQADATPLESCAVAGMG